MFLQGVSVWRGRGGAFSFCAKVVDALYEFTEGVGKFSKEMLGEPVAFFQFEGDAGVSHIVPMLVTENEPAGVFGKEIVGGPVELFLDDGGDFAGDGFHFVVDVPVVPDVGGAVAHLEFEFAAGVFVGTPPGADEEFLDGGEGGIIGGVGEERFVARHGGLLVLTERRRYCQLGVYRFEGLCTKRGV